MEKEVLGKPVDAQSTHRLLTLLNLPECDRCNEVSQEPAIYGRLELAERLLAACRAKLPGHPREILALSTLVRCILRHTPKGPAPEPQIASETYALAMAHHGNALRILGQLGTAAHLFSDARYFLRNSGSVDPMVDAELDCLEGSLLIDQRHFRAAQNLIEKGVATWREVDEVVETGKALLALAMVERQLDHLDLCQEMIEEALQCFEETGDEQLASYAWQNLAVCLCERTQYHAAKKLVSERQEWRAPSAPPINGRCQDRLWPR